MAKAVDLRADFTGLALPHSASSYLGATQPRLKAHLAEISAAVEPGADAVLLLDQAGWHTTAKLTLPDNITMLPLPAKAPELNPVENIWQFMRDNWVSNRIFGAYDQSVVFCSEAWNRLGDQPWRVMSIGLRDCAHDCLSLQIGINLTSRLRTTRRG